MANDFTTGLISGAMTRSEFGESDVDDYFETNTENMHVRVVNLRVGSQNADGSSFIWGNTTYGIWGSFYWSGSMSTPMTRIKEQFMWIDYNEDFTTTTYMPRITPLAYYKFEDNLQDSSGNARHLTGSNTVGSGVGKVGSALYLTTGSRYAFIGDNFSGSNGLSISFWMKPSFVGAGSTMWILNKYESANNGWGVHIASTGSLSIYDDINGSDILRYGSPVIAGSWYHVVAIFEQNGSSLGYNYLYVNNRLLGSHQSSTGSINQFTGSWFMGQRGNASGWFHGSLDDVRFYGQELGSSQVNSLYNSGFGTALDLSDSNVSTVQGWGAGSAVFQTLSGNSSIVFTIGSYTSTIGAVAGSIILI